ncbi:AraC family transcriptional regulator [Bacillus sp. FJAT-49711]|uniref:AraC family transcriptional regulator n=1 Tax=Bacillus sp. FJAT-49711 TaxID=2833585 RepID=UPI001BCA004D|nr:AraC family transcriptional regulator [Bacillus sp. FJAT-49711]MBS4219096.1 AraC family transcriptional regulator [Bacillus sp. FJAT-49711]
MIRGAFSSFRFRSVFIKISLSLCALVILPILIVGLFGNWYSQKIIQKEVDQSSLQMLDQTRRLMDNELNNIDSITVQLANNDSLIDAIQMQNIDTMEPHLNNIQYYLRDLYISSPYIDSIYVYYQNIDMIQSAITGLHPMSEFEQKEIINIFDGMDKKRKWVLPTTVEGRMPENSTVTLIRPIPLIGKDNSGAIIVNLNRNVLFQNHSARLMREGEQIWMLHPNDNFGFDTREGKSLTPIELRNVKGEINGDMNTFIKKFRGEKYSFTSVTSPHTGWKYIYLVPTNTLYSGSYVIKVFMFLLSAISIMFSIILAIIIAKKIYNPIQALINIINSHKNKIEKNIQSTGEVPFILSSFEQLSLDQQLLKNELQNNLSAFRESYLKTLLYEKSARDNERLFKLEDYGVKFTTFGYFVGVLRIDDYDDFKKRNNDLDIELYKKFIEKVSEEVATEIFNTVTINMDGSDIILICNLKKVISTNETNENAYKMFTTISHQITHYLDLSITIGIGEVVSGIGAVSTSFEKAIQSLNLTSYKGNGSIVAYWQIESNKNIYNNIFGKVGKAEEAILLAIKNKDEKQIEQSVFDFFSLFKSSKEYPFTLIQHVVLSLVNSIIEKLSNLGLPLNVEKEISALYIKVIHFDSIDQLENWASSYILELNSLLEKEFTHVNHDVTEHILGYIQANFNKEISLNGIADKLALDPSHISRIFKQKFGTNFMEYTITLRLDKAKELLTASDVTVKEIGQLVGYTNIHSFIRIFKKYEGITPGKYREINNRKMLDVNKVY